MTKIPNPEQAAEQDRTEPDDAGGQVSEASTMADAGKPIQPDQSVAGAPDDDGVDEGAQGPNANPNAGARKA